MRKDFDEVWEETDKNDATRRPGWYAVMYSWDASEGIFTESAYWDGVKWCYYPTKEELWLPIYMCSTRRFEDSEAADEYAENYNPEDGDWK